jgi:hypothetical protein
MENKRDPVDNVWLVKLREFLEECGALGLPDECTLLVVELMESR